MRHWRDRLAVRVALALVVTLWFGVAGALGGLGCHYLFPARYRSTGSVVVSNGDSTEPLTRAHALAASARSPETLSRAILVGDLYRYDRGRVSLGDLAGQLDFTARVVPAYSGAVVEVSMTYSDAHRVQQALDSVIRHIVSEDAPRYARVGSFARNSRNAGAAVRVAGLEPGVALLAGLIAGLILHSVYAQLRRPRPVEGRLRPQ